MLFAKKTSLYFYNSTSVTSKHTSSVKHLENIKNNFGKTHDAKLTCFVLKKHLLELQKYNFLFVYFSTAIFKLLPFV